LNAIHSGKLTAKRARYKENAAGLTRKGLKTIMLCLKWGFMKFKRQKLMAGLGAILLLASSLKVTAFALLGPIQPWMQESNGVIGDGDIGGPMDIGSGYRWNVPVVTYGFDQSFINYFGTNGEAAVTSAIQILNNLPPASQLAVTDYSFITKRMNYQADAQNLCDLKSAALSALLEQMGLAPPTRNVFVLKQWTSALLTNPPTFENADFIEISELGWFEWWFPDYIAQRNFDPQTLEPSAYVDEVLYSGELTIYKNQNANFISILPVNPSDNSFFAVADGIYNTGNYYAGLSYDDVGGWCYLFSTNNVNYETLLPDICGVGTNANSWVNGAWRPGVDKITFIPHSQDPVTGAFLPMTNCFTDSYITNGALVKQQLARTISRPDFLFSVADLTNNLPSLFYYIRTGTTNWLNNAVANGNTNGEGPGVIEPSVQITFNKLGGQFTSADSVMQPVSYSGFSPAGAWGSYDGSTNAPITYPIYQATNQLTVRMWLIMGLPPNPLMQSFEWKPVSASGTPYVFQMSADLTTWSNLFTVTNNGSVCTYFNESPAGSSCFYRLVPQ
jgi:hypothetical protein